jgi:hypothetical protein
MTAKRLKRPRDPVQLGKLVGDILTGQVEDRVPPPIQDLSKDQAAVFACARLACIQAPGIPSGIQMTDAIQADQRPTANLKKQRVEMHKHNVSLLSVLAVLIWLGFDGAAMAQQRIALPLPDGTFALKRAYCGLARSTALGKNEAAFIDLQQDRIRYYESDCRIRDLKIVGTSARFREMCVGEGETEMRNTTWRLLSRTSFSFNGQTYTFCGRKLSSPR